MSGGINKNSGYGQAQLGKLTAPTTGRTFVVVNSSDNNIDELQQLFNTDGFGQVRYFTSINSAVDAMDTNRNDTIILNNQGGHALTEMIDFSISRSHIWGLDYLLGNIRYQGARSRITLGVTEAATDIAALQNTGVGNSFKAFKIDSSNTKDESLYGLVEAGEYAYYEGVEVYKSTDLDETAAAEVLHNGDSALFKHCSFGSTINIIADNKIRPNVLLSRATITGKYCRDSAFVDCDFLSKAGGTEHNAVYGANAKDVERFLKFQNCRFINNPLSAATPAAAIAFGAAQTEGAVFCDSQCSVVDHTVMGTTGQGIYVQAPSSPTYATSGLSVAS